MGKILAVGVVWLLIRAIIWGGIIYVAWHFISKYW